jgi:phosphoadenosine phosphosulfate reductase
MDIALPSVSQVEAYLARYGHLSGKELLRPFVAGDYPGRTALVSSFGTDSSVLLHMLSELAPATPVVFVNTGRLFGETLRYRDQLVGMLGLTDVREVGPEPMRIDAEDPEGLLFAKDPDRCCHIRKTLPLNRAIQPFDAWITGRKRFQAATRANLQPLEMVEGKMKINPLYDWSQADVDGYMERHGLPHHPLREDGFLSIGCMPCTDRVAPGEDPRAGRWRGKDKTECGIHLPSNVPANAMDGI